MNGFPPAWVQHILFYIPYAFTAMTCVTLLVGDVEGDGGTDILRGTGFCNSLIFGLYMTGLLGPHYLKICCGFLNCAVAAILTTQLHFRSAILLLAVYCIPAFIFVVQAIWVPSITEIVPRLYLSNQAAAFSPKWLHRFNITHILDMTASSRSHPKYDITLKKVYVKDFLGSQGSLNGALPECMDFVDKAMTQQAENNILIHCTAGQSRSAAFLLYYLMVRQERRTWGEVYSFLRRRRPVVDISSDHIAPLRALNTENDFPRKDR